MSLTGSKQTFTVQKITATHEKLNSVTSEETVLKNVNAFFVEDIKNTNGKYKFKFAVFMAVKILIGTLEI